MGEEHDFPNPVCAEGDRLWIKEKNDLCDKLYTCTSVDKQHKVKKGSLYKYTLKRIDGQGEEEDEILETRLLHLDWRIDSDRKKLKKKRKEEEITSGKADADLEVNNKDDVNTEKLAKKKMKKESKESKRKSSENHDSTSVLPPSATSTTATSDYNNNNNHNDGNEASLSKKQKTRMTLPPHRYILAPMVGGSELPFRLLCRKYGAQLAYTPMISSERFAVDEEYRKREFQSIPEDRPLVAHFSANDPAVALAAARYVEDHCEAIDINLGCPQRIAHAGHFGSYLLGIEDRPLVLSIVSTLSSNLKIPVFVKIRLLDTVPETITLCKQLAEAGAALICIHARYRVNLVGRTGPGARDGPAHLDQVVEIRQALKDHVCKYTGQRVAIIANGNVITWNDVVENLKFTQADGIMSAEGILDDPSLFKYSKESTESNHKEGNKTDSKGKSNDKDIKKSKDKDKDKDNDKDKTQEEKEEEGEDEKKKKQAFLLEKISLAKEYIDLVKRYPAVMKTVIFHTRRIIRDALNEYQLMETLVQCQNVDEVLNVILKAESYAKSGNYKFDPLMEQKAKAAAERRKRDEGKRKDFEARMMRKAKREGKNPDYYLSKGLEPPTLEDINELKKHPNKEEAFAIWKERFSQHCHNYHFASDGCQRERTCPFLHVDVGFGSGDSAVAFG